MVVFLLLLEGGGVWLYYFVYYQTMFILFCLCNMVFSGWSFFAEANWLLSVMFIVLYGVPPFLGFLYKVVFMVCVVEASLFVVLFFWLVVFLQRVIYINMFLNLVFFDRA